MNIQPGPGHISTKMPRTTPLRSFLQQLRLGFRSLLLHKLRSALAVLGILIGVTAVIWLVAMGEGVSYQAQQQIKDLGATSIIVRSINITRTNNGTNNRTTNKILTLSIQVPAAVLF